MQNLIKYIPIIDKNGRPLMPMIPGQKVNQLLKSKKATPFYCLGIFCLRLNYVIENPIVRPIGIAIDSGSKFESYTIRSKTQEYFHIYCDAVDWVKDRLEVRSNLRRVRRFRKTPCRPPRFRNRAASKMKGKIPPSTKARRDLQINIVKKLMKILPITHARVEDIVHKTITGKNRKNLSFSPLQAGKKYLKRNLQLLGLIYSSNRGGKTAQLRKKFGLFKLPKLKDKGSKDFAAHAVDTAVMAANLMGADNPGSNPYMYYISPIKFGTKIGGRRQLHKERFNKNGKRTRSRGRLVSDDKLCPPAGSIVKYIGINPKLKIKKYYRVSGYIQRKVILCPAIKNSSLKDDRIGIWPLIQDIKLVCYTRFTYLQVNCDMKD